MNTKLHVVRNLLIKNILLLPNVELRMLPVTNSSKLLNIHCIFNPDYVPLLANDFFNMLENEANFKMNRDGIISYGKRFNPTADDQAAYTLGIDRFALDPGSLKTLLDKKENFRNNTLIVVSNSNRDGNSGYQEHYSLFENEPGSLDGVRSTIYQISDAIFSANPKDVAYFLGKRKDNDPGITAEQMLAERSEVLAERGTFKACLVGCDAHTEADLFKRFTWVKGMLNFQGLRQIMYEPEQRVKIQNDEPDPKDAKLIIDQIRFIASDDTFTPLPIKFNRNLNVIIGGKSSGKSILLYNIAKTLLSDRTILRNEEYPHNYKYTFPENFNFEVSIASGQTQNVTRPDETPSILPEIKYIPQNHLSRLAESDNKKGNELIKLIRSLLLEDSEYQQKYEEFVGRLKSNDGRMELIINGFFELRDRLSAQRTALIQQGDESVLQSNINANKQKIQSLKESAGLSEEAISQYNGLNSQLQNADNELSKLRNDFSKMTNFNTDAKNILQELAQKKTLLVQSVENDLVWDFLDIQYKILEEALTKITELIELFATDSSRQFVHDNIFKSTVDGLNESKKRLSVALEPFLKNLANKKQIEDLEKLVLQDQQKTDAIAQLRSEIANNQTALNEEKDRIFIAYGENFEEYNRLVTDFLARTRSLENDRLRIVGKPRFNFPKFRNKISQRIDGRKANYDHYPLLNMERSGTSDFTIDELTAQLKTMFLQMVESSTFPFTSKVDLKASVKELFTDYFYDYWDVEYDQDELTKMSSGKASFVILMLIVGLSKSKAPILIDQPEDNLDNRSITKDLVEYLRNKKLERQIIIVTHNANVVVNADAENIIVANQKGQNDNETTSPYRFDYTNGPLEFSQSVDTSQSDLLKSMGIREHVTEIVEGGEDAFKKRERKYGFTKR